MKRALPSILLLALPASADTLLVVNKRDATLAFVDPAAMNVIGIVATGQGPHEVAVSDDGKTAVVCNYGTGPNPGPTLSLIDVAARKELRRVTLSGLLRPHGIEAFGSRFCITIWAATASACSISPTRRARSRSNRSEVETGTKPDGMAYAR